MQTKIKRYLTEIEQEKGIEILLAVETGSRAWGFPSPDSDYDIRIIYKHNKDWYLSLSEEKDSIDLMLDNNEIDITGWDLRKSLRLLLKSNPPLLERIQSPITYQVDEVFLKGIQELAGKSYSRIATIHHYLSMGKNCLEETTGHSDYKLKKFFYALRSSIAALWILKKSECPPIEFQKMLAGLELPKEIVIRIKELIELKSTIGEGYLHSGEKELFDFMDHCISRAEQEAKNLPVGQANIVEFNQFFRSQL